MTFAAGKEGVLKEQTGRLRELEDKERGGNQDPEFMRTSCVKGP